MASVVRPYRGVSAQDRREDRRARLLEACLDAVGGSGSAAVTAEAVCAGAGLSKRYFYESFSDRDAVLTAALGRVFESVAGAIGAALSEAGDDRVRRVELTVSALIDTLAADTRAARLYVEAAGHPALRAARDVAVDDFATLLARDVLGSDPDDPQVRLTALVVVAGTTEAVTRWLAGHIAVQRDTLVAQIVAIGVAVGATPSG